VALLIPYKETNVAVVSMNYFPHISLMRIMYYIIYTVV
jgi:hypothetical protein